MALTEKNQPASKANREVCKQFLRKQHRFKLREQPIIYLKESGFRKSADCTHGYALKGKPYFGRYDWHGRNQTKKK